MAPSVVVSSAPFCTNLRPDLVDGLGGARYDLAMTAQDHPTNAHPPELSAAIEALRSAGRHPPRALADAVLHFGYAAVAPMCEVLRAPETWVPQQLPEAMFPLHLIYLLGCLGDPLATPTLLEVMCTQDLGDHLTEGAASVLGALGPGAVPELVPVLVDHAADPWVRNAVGRGLFLVGSANPEARPEVAAALARVLREADLANENDFLTAELLVDDAIRTGHPDAMAAARDVFARGLVDTDPDDESMGDLLVGRQPWQRRAHDKPPMAHFEWASRAPRAPTSQLTAPTPTTIPVRATPKVGRNEPCPCGSGKKFKKCCGR
ncbi:MAG: SEC-C domain-containing protein [Gemmatimonadaceae bacterium]|jgi:hypothetical protein|nr:SEC-C domain-containing protein [Gemmatimonadaceae bacterium]